MKSEGVKPASSYKATIVLISKLIKDTRKKGNYRPTSLTNVDENIFTKYLKTELNSTLKKYIVIKLAVFQACKDGPTQADQQIQYNRNLDTMAEMYESSQCMEKSTSLQDERPEEIMNIKIMKRSRTKPQVTWKD